MTDAAAEDGLDLSWLDTTKKILTADKNYDKEPSEYITFHFCYVNKDIQKIITEKHHFSDKTHTSLSSQFLNTLISEKSKLNGLQYVCKSVSTFFVDLEPEHVQQFTKTTTYYDFFTKDIDLQQDLVCPPTIFVFHSLNSLFFLFEEAPPLELLPRSILKAGLRTAGSTKKRVSFHNKTCKGR